METRDPRRRERKQSDGQGVRAASSSQEPAASRRSAEVDGGEGPVTEPVAAHIERIHAITEALSETLTPDGVAEAVCRHARFAFGAEICMLHLLGGHHELAMIGHTGLAPDTVDSVRRIRADMRSSEDDRSPDHAAARALATNEILWAETSESVASIFPETPNKPRDEARPQAFWIAPLTIGGRPLGVLSLGFTRPRRFTRDDRSVARTISRQCAVALERARVFAEAQANEQRLRFLAEASTVLGSSLDFNATLASVVRIAVPLVADWAAVDMLQTDGAFVRLAVAHSDPERKKLAEEIWRRWPSRLGEPYGIGHVAATGEPSLEADILPETFDAVPDPSLRAIYRALGLRSSMCVPLQVRGRTVGVLSFVSAESGRRFGASDLTLACDLALRAGVAIENAQSFREASEANRMKDEFLATMSHELRTPLGAILGWASMLQKDKTKEPQTLTKGLRAIERNARAQAKLIDDVLDVSRIITGRLRLEPKPIDPKVTLNAALEVVRPAAEAKGVTIETQIDEEPLPTFADPDRMQQIMWNLLSNSVKFTPKGGGVRVRLARDQGTICLQVTDTGQGIAPDFLPFIFERFRQADSSTTRRHAGLGLGLAIARHLVESHGGTIRAESPGDGKGSTFTVTLPMRALRIQPTAAAASENKEDAKRARSSPTSLEGLCVVVCDDDPDTREILSHVLSEADAEVFVADGAAAALELVRLKHPDVLVSDIGMPLIDGYALLQQLRRLPAAEGRNTPALALTAYVRGEDVRRALDSGFQTHVAKPVDPKDLIACVASLAGRRGLR